MAAHAPMATWKPFTGKSTRSLVPDIICVHTMVGTLSGSWAWANQAGNPYWHFGLGGDGTLWQCVDLDFRSAANLEGNYHVIPIETADMGAPFPSWSGSNVPAWTPAQVDKLVSLITWLCKQFQIPPVLVPDTKPVRRGLAYHRQGIDPWRAPGGEKWSNATGKQCPGDRRITQFRNTVIPRVQAALTGEDDMTPAECEAAVRKVLNEGTGTGLANWADTNQQILSVGRQTFNRVGAVQASIGTIDEAVVAALTEAITEAGGTVTGEVVEAAVRRVFADAAVPD